MSDMVKRLKRNPERWAAMNMTAVMEGSPAQALFALEDAKADIATLAAELSRLSALVAEWEKAAEPFVRVADFIPDPRLINTEYPGVMESAAPSVRNAIGKLTLGDFRRLSQLKDTTNADK